MKEGLESVRKMNDGERCSKGRGLQQPAEEKKGRESGSKERRVFVQLERPPATR
jgi:hypothetical protein